jgi:hypothetical protein
MKVYIALSAPSRNRISIGDVEILGAWKNRDDAELSMSRSIDDAKEEWRKIVDHDYRTMTDFQLKLLSERFEIREVVIGEDK